MQVDFRKAFLTTQKHAIVKKKKKKRFRRPWHVTQIETWEHMTKNIEIDIAFRVKGKAIVLQKNWRKKANVPYQGVWLFVTHRNIIKDRNFASQIVISCVRHRSRNDPMWGSRCSQFPPFRDVFSLHPRHAPAVSAAPWHSPNADRLGDD